VADVVARCVSGMSAANAAAAAGASATSARRWSAWTRKLCDPAEALALVARIDPGAMLAGVASVLGELAVMLDVLERVGTALVRRGVELACQSGVGRVLEWQHRVHRIVIWLTVEPRCLSPPMARPS
jgi:hypothetical protein